MHWIETKVIELSAYEGIPNLDSFIEGFEDKLLEPHQLLALEEALKATPMRWWDAHKASVRDC